MKSRHVATFRRRKEGKTDYKKRLKLLSSGKPRLVVRVTGRNVIVQIIEYVLEGDKTQVSAVSSELKGFGWSAY
ncbi:MAG: 50S ribosomal protein L18, partial [Candidatus Aenigmarchaeota archaeon]|nr:50S ribosomal protein L18 [Candidatus Aenigmarchaeota archaeon]